MDQKTRKIVLTVVVGIFALVCLLDMCLTYFSYSTVFNTLEEAEAATMRGIKLVRVEITEDNAVLITLRFTVVYDTDAVTQKILLNIYANGEYLGNYSINERVALKQGDTDVIFKVVISPYYVPKLKEITESSQHIEWHIKGGAVLEYPSRGDTIPEEIDETWVMP